MEGSELLYCLLPMHVFLYDGNVVCFMGSKTLETDVFFGPVNTYVLSPVARYAGVWNIPVLTTGGQATGFRNKKSFPLLTNIGLGYGGLPKVFKEITSHFNW